MKPLCVTAWLTEHEQKPLKCSQASEKTGLLDCLSLSLSDMLAATPALLLMLTKTS